MLNYTGQRRDETGLLFYNARYYDPAIGRFISSDTVVPGNASGGMDGVALRPLTVAFHEPGFISKLNQENQFGPWYTLSDDARQQVGSSWGPSNPQALNRYSYVLNNPMRWTDPSGHVKSTRATFKVDPNDIDRLNARFDQQVAYRQWGVGGAGIALGAFCLLSGPLAPGCGTIVAGSTFAAAAKLEADQNGASVMLQDAAAAAGYNGVVEVSIEATGITINAYDRKGKRVYEKTIAIWSAIGESMVDAAKDQGIPIDYS